VEHRAERWRSVLVAGGFLAWMVLAAVRTLPPAALRPPPGGSGLPAAYYPWAYSHFSYSDILTLYGERHLAAHALPIVHQPVEYPVLMDLAMWAAAWVPGLVGYFLATATLLALSGLVALAAFRRAAPRRWWIFAASPLIAAYGLVNWDLFGIVWLAASWWAYREDRPAWAGVFVGLGASTKLFPLASWPFMAWAWWTAGRRRDAVILSLALLGTLVLVNAPFAWANWHNWTQFVRYNTGRLAIADLWVLVWPHIRPHTVDLLSLLLVLAMGAAALGGIGRGWDPARAAAAVFTGWMIANKVFSPQYMLWVLAFGVLAEWPLSALALVTLGGLADDANSFGSLAVHSLYPPGNPLRVLVRHRLFPLGLLLRYATMALAGALGLGAGPSRPPVVRYGPSIRYSRVGDPGSGEP
jgi:hypothetical protein